MVKYVCIKPLTNYFKLIEDEIYDIKKIKNSEDSNGNFQIYIYKNGIKIGDGSFYSLILEEYFIPLSEYRQQRINEIFNEN